ncbi:YfhO family protein [Pseudalkalibacillus sp. A8]|uniref:YfhO family protein n=1 Tax=Pseudalkalibacillus sp. A8 TaxID=3382641 RepID=UPI0038B489E6
MRIFILLISSLILSVLTHMFFIIEWINDRYMVGPNDGLGQILTFKKLLYEQYTSGNLFYSYAFGFGAGTYSQLAYYFSTSIFFILTLGVIVVLQSGHIVETVDILFWSKAAVYLSICRLTLIIFISTLVFRYMKSNWFASFIGASVYAITILYFRHATYWEFFADALLWIPLLVFGVEKIFREARIEWFMFAVAITSFDNFYFAYINLIFIAVYILIRWFIKLDKEEVGSWRKFRLLLISGVTGFGISLVSFIPAVHGLFNNHRPPYNKPIPFFHWDNIFFASGYVIVPILFLIFLYSFSLYKNPVFRLFTILSLFLLILHFSPMVASFFNGFSAPQYRWEYILNFTMGGTVASGLHNLMKIGKRELVLSTILVIATYFGAFLYSQRWSITSFPILIMFTLLFLTIALLLVFNWRRSKALKYVLHVWILLITLVLGNIFQYSISTYGHVNNVSKEHLSSEKYNGPEQQALLQQLKRYDPDPYYRVDWKIGYSNNTPIIQGYNGMSVYSSILNRHLISFYLHDLHIDMGRESVSRYATLGNRANLHSMLQGKYMMIEKKHRKKIPYGFKKIMDSEHYAIYENTNILPFVRTANRIFLEKDLENSHALEREQAMLEGVIVTSRASQTGTTPKISDIIDQATIKTPGATYKDDLLSVTKKRGGIDLFINESNRDTKDYYVSFHLESLAESEGFALKVNDYRTTRKHNRSIYKTFVDDLTIRIPKAEKIKIRLPKGEYILKDLALYEEDYRSLEKVKSSVSKPIDFHWDDNRIKITYNNQSNAQYMVLPIPYEKGWKATINNENQTVEKVNYSSVGIPLKEGMNRIEFVYAPPYFWSSLAVSVTSLILGIWLIWRQREIRRE